MLHGSTSFLGTILVTVKKIVKQFPIFCGSDELETVYTYYMPHIQTSHLEDAQITHLCSIYMCTHMYMYTHSNMHLCINICIISMYTHMYIRCIYVCVHT